ncbi:MAG: LysR family transcriptional regulator [Bacteroidetes bacterium]|nr:LysR family transcriptional regulator [Bacteroidota bacterium]
MTNNKIINVKFRIWFFAGEEKLLGIGRVELLERINTTGSIAKAAKEMKMSYRQAWQMVNEMNQRSAFPFVVKHLGGKSGGGAIVTEAGLKTIKAFNELQEKIEFYIKQEASKIKL